MLSQDTSSVFITPPSQLDDLVQSPAHIHAASGRSLPLHSNVIIEGGFHQILDGDGDRSSARIGKSSYSRGCLLRVQPDSTVGGKMHFSRPAISCSVIWSTRRQIVTMTYF